MGGWVSNLVLSYNLSHSPTPSGWLREGDAHPQDRGRSGWEQAAKVRERQGSPLGPVLPAKAGLSCCWSHGDSLFIFAIRWASNAVLRRQNKRKKGKLKSSLGQTVMEVHCSTQGYARATKMVFNSPNRSGLGRGWGQTTPTLNTSPQCPKQRKTLPCGLTSTWEVLRVAWGWPRGHSEMSQCGTERCLWFLPPAKGESKHHMPAHAILLAFCKQNKDACLLSCICSSRSFSIKQ